MKTVNSLSGGKTSSYMAYHYPADYNLFACVLVNDENCTPKDKFFTKAISDKLGRDFIGTAESDITLQAILDLEQLIGKEIIWVSGITFDELIAKRKAIPNQQWRFCTTELKMRPIWDWWFKNINEKIKMGIGFRYDELERADRLTNKFKGIVGKRGSQNAWEEIEWREGYFPLIDNKVIHPQVIKWANQTNLKFPQDSNCVGCFHKPLQQLRKNFEDEPKKMNWFMNIENKMKGTFKKEMSYEKVKSIGLQQDFFFGTGSGCQAGFCTD